MNSKRIIIITLICLLKIAIYSQESINLDYEYSMDEFQRGIRAFHNTQYEQAIIHFLKSLSFYDDNKESRYFLGEAYRKAGYEQNALFVWNYLLSTGYESRYLKSKIAYLYGKKGLLNQIFIDKGYLLREDIKGFYSHKEIPLFIKPAQIFVDEKNHYFITSFLTQTIVELDSNLKFVRNYISTIPKIEAPFGIVVDKNGNLYVSDFKRDVILKINNKNIVEKEIGFKDIGEGGLLGPKHLLIDDDSNLYVSDSGNKRINKYTLDGKILFSFGTEKNGDGKLTSPNGLFYYNENIYVCDRDTNRIVIFDKNGNYIRSFGEDYLVKPYDITRDALGRFLILCEKDIWVYEENNSLWYKIDTVGSRLERGISIASDKDKNILITDFNRSRLLVLSLERERYTNLNINIDRILSQKFPSVHVILTVEKDDFSSPTGIDSSNITIYENGRMVPMIGTLYTKNKNEINDIVVIYDRNSNMKKYKDDFKKIMDSWIKDSEGKVNLSLVSVMEDRVIIENDFGSSRLSILDSIDDPISGYYTDKGIAIKTGIYHMLNRFSKKAIIIVTDSTETGMDFEKFKIEDAISLAKNNDIPIYVVSFSDGNLTELYKYIAKKTNGDYYRAYKRSDLKDLFKKIIESKGREIVVSYRSSSRSRFGEEPINVEVEIEYNGIKGWAKSVYYPPIYR